MGKNIEVGYAKRATVQAATLLNTITAAAAAAAASHSGATLDSATRVAVASSEVTAALSASGDMVSEQTQAVFDQFGQDAVVGAIYDSAQRYEYAHGTPMPADLLEQGLHNAFGQTDEAKREYKLDSATNLQHDGLSLQPNRAVLAIYATADEAVPFAHYLPADIRSNQATLAILSHHAGAANGQYVGNELMDGINAGKNFLSGLRVHKAMPDASTGEVSFKITAIQDTAETCDQSAPAVATIRGRGAVYINGLKVGVEANTGSSGGNPVNGRVTIEGQAYIVGGSYNPDTGEGNLTTTPPLPATVPVYFEAPLDFERKPELISEVTTMVQTFHLYASPWRAKTRTTIDARTQMANELGLDPYSESVVAIQRQYAIERHRRALALMRRVAPNIPGTYNFDWSNRSSDMTRARIWQDFGAELGRTSQVMVEKTLDHGISHLYVGKDLKSQWEGLGSDLFIPSGVAERPGIYRFGKIFGKYDCYYDPSAKETANSAEVLAIGRATNVARNPVVFGDAVSPMVQPLANTDDLRNGAGFYARDFTEINPHEASAYGAAVLTITNIR